MTNLQQFISVISDSKGNISSTRFRKSYFESHNYLPLWDWFEDQSKLFDGYSNKDIITLLSKGFSSPPKCIVCNSNNAKVQHYNGKSQITIKYCSKECSSKCTDRNTKISKSKTELSKIDKNVINDKRKSTMLQKYGVAYNSQRDDIKLLLSEKLSKHQLHEPSRDFLLDRDWLYNEYVVNKRTSVDIADQIGVFYDTVLEYCRKYGFEIRKYSNKSLPQKQIYDYIKSLYNGEILYNDWSILNSHELDIYIPEFKLAIEHNGLYSHSANSFDSKNKFKHISKTNKCNELGIQLIHIREDQWKNKSDIVKSIIKNKLGLSDKKIYARQCKIVELSSNITRKFCMENHIQGYFDSKIRYGLEYETEIVAVMTFNKCRNRSKGDWELVRFCNKLNHNVVGGFSRLLKTFTNSYTGSIISYCDRQRSNGSVYIKNGFKLLNNNIEPSYAWTDKKCVYSREQFQKYKLKSKLKIYSEELSEFENMFNNGYRVIYDSGQLTFLLE